MNDHVEVGDAQEGWILTCQSRCVSQRIRVEYPD
jgi:hypothetical protein